MSGREVSPADCRRWIKTLGQRVACGEDELLPELLLLKDDIDRAARVAVAMLRENGKTDGQLAELLGVSRQAVQKRWPEGGRPTGAGARYRRLPAG